MKRLADKICIITGGAGSIGFATARLFVDEGARVVIVDRDEAALATAAAALDGDRVLAVAADVTRAADTEHYVAATLARFGGLDVLFSNAGNDGPILPVTDYPEAMFDSIMAVHVRGSYLACKYAVPHMANGGSIIITSSVVGVMGVPANCAYVAAKHAQIGLARGIAKEVAGRGIRVNTINPGPVDNDFMRAAEIQMTAATGSDAAAKFNQMIPLGRHVDPVEVARGALFLASPDSSFTTGSTLMIDGGMSA